MKKTILIAMLLVGMTSVAFAEKQVGNGTGTTLGTTNFQTSTNVALYATSTITTYDACSKNSAGDTTFVADESSPTITENQKAGFKGDIINSSSCGGAAE